ncbi:hypothetical protein VRB37_16615 [Erwinia billingiae]|uniref:hypothetical protein n=1 Tax=Erwinia billingiae TaxID=182337 RepID=UPI0030D32097
MTNPIAILSRERLEQLADENTICKVSWDERIEMARALLAVMDAKKKSELEFSQVNSEKQALIYWLINEINLIESARDETPFGLDDDGEMALKGVRIALSAMTAQPVCYTGSGSMEAINDGREGYIWIGYENSHPIGLYATPPASSAPDGWATLPAKISADNGAKAALSGEFLEVKFISCPECFGDDDCDSCDGSGRVKVEIPVSWTTIKAIWEKGVQHFSAVPAPGVD